MKNLLFITGVFPPTGGTSVMRSVAFVKYLNEFGWRPIVLTAANPQEPYDEALLNEIPSGVQIYRTRAIKPPGFHSAIERYTKSREIYIDKSPLYKLYSIVRSLLIFLFIPDTLIGWIPFAIKKGIQLVRKYNIQLIFVTGPPFSTYISGYILRKVLGIPLILDFRDSCVPGNAQHTQPVSKPRWRNRLLERLVVHASDKVITVTRMITKMMQERYPPSRSKFLTITNGFDAETLTNLEDYSINNEKMKITYVGRLHGVRTARYFLQAIEKVVSEENRVKNKLQVSFVGYMKPEELRMLDRAPLRHVASFTPFVPYHEAIKRMYESDVLLLVVYSGPGVLTNKIFEYIGVGRPILALVPTDGEAAQLINENDFGVVVAPSDVEAIKEAVYGLFLQWDKRNLRKYNDPRKVRRFDRKNLTQELAKVFNEVSAEHDNV